MLRAIGPLVKRNLGTANCFLSRADSGRREPISRPQIAEGKNELIGNLRPAAKHGTIIKRPKGACLQEDATTGGILPRHRNMLRSVRPTGYAEDGYPTLSAVQGWSRGSPKRKER